MNCIIPATRIFFQALLLQNNGWPCKRWRIESIQRNALNPLLSVIWNGCSFSKPILFIAFIHSTESFTPFLHIREPIFLYKKLTHPHHNYHHTFRNNNVKMLCVLSGHYCGKYISSSIRGDIYFLCNYNCLLHSAVYIKLLFKTVRLLRNA